MSGPARDHGAAGDVGRLDVLSSEPYDALIIGGGINGAGIARELARRGLSVALVERDDFGWGTTWRSTKLIHGGLRYLEHAEFGLVFESLRDRTRLLAEYPDMVRPLRFLLPVFHGDRHRPAAINLGLLAYDLLAHSRSMPRHRRLSGRKALELEPALRRDGLRAAFTYSDGQVAYPERLCIQTILEAADAGAVVLNHAEALELIVEGDRVRGAVVGDSLGDAAREVRATITINAAGPWVDAILARAGRPAPRQLGGTKGSHIVVDYRGRGPVHPIYAEARSDHRPFFVIPWRGVHLVGTTDTRFSGDPAEVRADESDLEYLVSEANALLPGARLAQGDVKYAYAGVRPLPASEGVREGAITRRHLIRDHAPDGLCGLISIIGGKLSTFPSLAKQVAARVQAARVKSRTNLPPEHEAGGLTSGPAGVGDVATAASPALLDYLRQLYGPRTYRVLAMISQQPRLAAPLCRHGPDIAAQVVVAAREEFGATLSDVLLRRTGVGWNPCHGLDCAGAVAEVMATERGWDAKRTEHELHGLEVDVRRTFIDTGTRSVSDTKQSDPRTARNVDRFA